MKLKYLIPSWLILIAFGCGDDSFPVPDASTAVAKFSVQTDGDNFAPDTITFTNESVVTSGTPTYLWNFGDGTTSSEESPTWN
jgi:PKD repeat protein